MCFLRIHSATHQINSVGSLMLMLQTWIFYFLTSCQFLGLICLQWPNQPLLLVVVCNLPFGLELQELLRKQFPFPVAMDEFRFKAFSEACKPFWVWLMFKMLLRPFVLLAPLWRTVYSGNQAQQSELEYAYWPIQKGSSMGYISVHIERHLYRLY